MPNQFFSPEGDLERHFITESWLIDQYLNTELWGWGQNGNVQLGDNTIISKYTPVTTFAGGTNWKQVSCGTEFVAAIKTDGTLWTWGSNSDGQLGINTTDIRRSTPVTTFAGGTNWKQVNCHNLGSSVLAIKTDGTLWVWGRNSYGQLGDNTTVNKYTPVTTFAGGNDWKQVSGQFHNTAAIKTDGTLWVWGRNSYGQLGNNSTIPAYTPITTFVGGTNWKQVSCGVEITFAIKTDGTLWGWGSNWGGQLGDNTVIPKSTPVTTFLGSNNWKFVECGQEHVLAIKTDGTLWTWGANYSGQLGDNTTISRSTPVTTFAGGTNWKQVDGDYHSIAIKTDGTLWAWGSNWGGQLGDNTVIDRSTPVTTFVGGNNWRQVSSGGAFSSALKFQYEGR